MFTKFWKLHAGELAKEIFVKLAQAILGVMAFTEADGGDRVDEFAQFAGLQLRGPEAIGEDALQARGVGFDRPQCRVDAHADVVCLAWARRVPQRACAAPQNTLAMV